MRIADKPDNDYSLFAKLIFKMQKRKFGQVLAPTRIWARSPWLYLGFSIFYAAIIRKLSPIAPTLRTLINAYVSQLNKCAFCIDLNKSELQKQGVLTAKIDALENYAENDLFTQQERSALAYAEYLTLSQQPSETLFQTLRNQFTDDEIIELTALITFQILSSKFNSALDIPAQGFCAVK